MEVVCGALVEVVCGALVEVVCGTLTNEGGVWSACKVVVER